MRHNVNASGREKCGDHCSIGLTLWPTYPNATTGPRPNSSMPPEPGTWCVASRRVLYYTALYLHCIALHCTVHAVYCDASRCVLYYYYTVQYTLTDFLSVAGVCVCIA